MRLADGKLGHSLGYIRYLYPDFSASTGRVRRGRSQGGLRFRPGDGGRPAALEPRTGWAGCGESWNKRALVSAPLPFLPLPFDASMRLYGAVGNFWLAKPEAIGLPTNDYWYWQVGLVTSVWGVDVTVAYTDTNLEPGDCGYTRLCAGRVFFSMTKVF